jgi:hypothetical protein
MNGHPRTRSSVIVMALLAGTVIPLPVPTTAQADPIGTVRLSEQTVPSTAMVRAVTENGMLYETDSAIGGDSQWWLKAPSAAPVKPAYKPGPSTSMAGRMLFDSSGPTIRYANWDGPQRSCPAAPYWTSYLPTGWAYADRGDATVKVVEATATGCTTRTFLAPTAAARPFLVFAGDVAGLVIQVRRADGSLALGYHRNTDPTHPIALRPPAGASFAGPPEIRGGAIVVAGQNGRNWRVPVNGGASTELPVLPEGAWETTTVTGTAAVPFYGDLWTAPAAGGPVQVLAGVKGLVGSDGISFYTNHAPGERPGIYARRSAATGAGTLVIPAPAKRYQTKQYGIALSAGRIYYTHRKGLDPMFPWPYDVKMRTMSGRPGSVSVGPEQTVRVDTSYASLSASAGRLVFDGNWQRTYTGQIRQMPTTTAAPPQASGNRWLIRWDRYRPPADVDQGRSMYDVRTGRTADKRTWPQGPQDLFGNYLLYTRADGAVLLQNLRTGTKVTYRRPGTPIRAVALHSRWAAWVTTCRSGDTTCAQTLTVRDLATGATRNFNTRKTTSFDLSGGYLGFDATWYTTRLLRTLRLGTGTVTVTGTLPANPSDGHTHEIASTPPRHFDLEDEMIGWLDTNHTGKLAHLTPFIDPPRHLGNQIAPASFATTWSMALPASKALPRCTVSLYYRRTKVRILNCSNTTGMATVTWDGRSGTGARLTPGTYTYRVWAVDEDNYWLRNHDGRLTPIIGTVHKTR